MFIDRVKLKFIGGKGGNGHRHFEMTRKPDGGDGGVGGNVYVKGSTHMFDLRQYRIGPREYRAGNAAPGGKSKLTGSAGSDIVLEFPIGTIFMDADTEYIKAEITNDKEKILLAKGGRGGMGNHNFRTGRLFQQEKTTPGANGYEFEAQIELRLSADVIFIGFPNAGKSSMLNALSNAGVKVGAYPFTTLIPHLGTTSKLRYMDLPGLIEGTSEGKGLGTGFVKHAEQGKLIAHFITLESPDPAKDYLTMRKELESLSDNLAAKPEVILLTKSDMFDEKYITEKVKIMKKFKKEIFVCSAFKRDEVVELEDELKKLVNKI